MRFMRSWSGYHRGLFFEIKHWGIDEKHNPKGTWCYYITISRNCIPEELLKEFELPPIEMKSIGLPGRYSYKYDTGLLASFDWHCGITYFKKLFGDNELVRAYEMGCDYAHYYDEGMTYDEKYLEVDARKTIDRIWELMPGLKVWCRTDGEICDPKDLELCEDGKYTRPRETDVSTKMIINVAREVGRKVEPSKTGIRE